MEELLLLYFKGGLDDEKRLMVEEWIASSEENRKTAEQVCWIHEVSEAAMVIKTADTENALSKVHGRIRHRNFRRFLSSCQKAAATLVLPLMLAGGYYAYHYYHVDESDYVELKTTTGMVSSITLPDNSKVWLNSNSHLKYPVRFSGKTRNVELQGEAYFKVEPDPDRKFIVSTTDMDIEVLGTEFNVDAYTHSGRDIQTTLVTGKVLMRYTDSKSTSRIVRMTPGQRLTYDPTGDSISLTEVNTSTVSSWKDGKIILDNTSLSDALRMIENRYNVRFIICNRELLDNRYTGQFVDQRLDTILEHFRKTTKIRFVRGDIQPSENGEILGPEEIKVF